MFRGRRHQRGGFGLFLLLTQIMNIGFDRIPPVTLATIGLNVAVFLRLIFPSKSVYEVCVSANSVWFNKQWLRLVTASIFHGDDWHLYYNMVSFVWKGMTLERKYGSAYFAYMLAVFSVLVNATLVGLDIGLSEFFNDRSYVNTCAVGFSGVIFALKVVTTYESPPGTQYVMGFIPMPSRWICWAELGLIQLLVPNASFTGHLAGILVGLAYVKGPLKTLMSIVTSIVPPPPGNIRGGGRSYTYQQGATGYRRDTDQSNRSGGSYTYQRGATGYRRDTDQSNRSGGSYTYQRGATGYRRDAGQSYTGYNYEPRGGNYGSYSGGMDEDEQMEWAMRNSRNDSNTPRQTPTAPPGEYSNNSSNDLPYPTSGRASMLQPQASYGTDDPPYPDGPTGPPPPYPGRGSNRTPYPDYGDTSSRNTERLYPTLPPEEDEIRRRRLARFS